MLFSCFKSLPGKFLIKTDVFFLRRIMLLIELGIAHGFKFLLFLDQFFEFLAAYFISMIAHDMA